MFDPSVTAGVRVFADAAAHFASPEDLYRSEYGRLCAALSLLVWDRESAADAVQEAFLEAWLNWKRVRGYDNPAAWVRRVAINRLLNSERSLRRRALALVRLSSARFFSAGQDIGDAPEIPNIVHFVRMLPEKQRLALVLHHVADMTVAETAEAMGISEGSVSQHLSRARSRLRKLMGETP